MIFLDDEFLKKWRTAYVKMLNDGYKKVVQEEGKYIKLYSDLKPRKLTLFEKFTRKIDTAIFKYDDEYWKKFDEESNERFYSQPGVINYHVHKLMKSDPKYKDLLYGLNVLGTSFHIMKGIAGASSNQWLLTVLKDFCEIYSSNPDIKDVEAMVQFIKKEDVIKGVEDLDTIPSEIVNNLDLGLDENLKEFVQQYGKEYLKDDISFGGKSL